MNTHCFDSNKWQSKHPHFTNRKVKWLARTIVFHINGLSKPLQLLCHRSPSLPIQSHLHSCSLPQWNVPSLGFLIFNYFFFCNAFFPFIYYFCSVFLAVQSHVPQSLAPCSLSERQAKLICITFSLANGQLPSITLGTIFISNVCFSYWTPDVEKDCRKVMLEMLYRCWFFLPEYEIRYLIINGGWGVGVEWREETLCPPPFFFFFLIEYLQIKPKHILLTKLKIKMGDQQTVKSNCVSPLCNKDSN